MVVGMDGLPLEVDDQIVYAVDSTHYNVSIEKSRKGYRVYLWTRTRWCQWPRKDQKAAAFCSTARTAP